MAKMGDLVGAVEAGGTKFVLGIARADHGPIIARHRIPTRAPAETLARMAEWFRSQERDLGSIAGFGIASFGPIDIAPGSPRYGTIGPTPKPGWSGVRYSDALSDFGVTVTVDTDVNGAALGEWTAGGNSGTLAYTTVGTGIGTGIVRAGKPLGGFSHFETGHIRVPHDRLADPFGGTCPFHDDCIEGLASGTAIAARWGHSLSHGSPEQHALVAGYLGDFAATLVLTHMPDRLVFGGGVMKAPGLLAAVRDAAKCSLGGYVPAWEGDLVDRIVSPALGDDAGLTGAVELARQAL